LHARRKGGDVERRLRADEPVLLMRSATEADFQAVITMLGASDLPYEDLDPGSMQEFLVAVESDVVGVIGLQRFGDVGLLRSLAVMPERRNCGLGAELVDALERRSRDSGLRHLYLLTTSAADFFMRRGYAIVPRAQAPATIQSTQQFSTLCPSQAVCLRKILE
jgi:amino-acid N-acetyltransferase